MKKILTKLIGVLLAITLVGYIGLSWFIGYEVQQTLQNQLSLVNNNSRITGIKIDNDNLAKGLFTTNRTDLLTVNLKQFFQATKNSSEFTEEINNNLTKAKLNPQALAIAFHTQLFHGPLPFLGNYTWQPSIINAELSFADHPNNQVLAQALKLQSGGKMQYHAHVNLNQQLDQSFNIPNTSFQLGYLNFKDLSISSTLINTNQPAQVTFKANLQTLTNKQINFGGFDFNVSSQFNSDAAKKIAMLAQMNQSSRTFYIGEKLTDTFALILDNLSVKINGLWQLDANQKITLAINLQAKDQATILANLQKEKLLTLDTLAVTKILLNTFSDIDIQLQVDEEFIRKLVEKSLLVKGFNNQVASEQASYTLEMVKALVDTPDSLIENNKQSFKLAIAIHNQKITINQKSYSAEQLLEMLSNFGLMLQMTQQLN